MLLYHGSKSGIRGDISPDKSRNACDFGQGFYMGNKEDQPKGLIAGRKDGRFYEIDYNIDGLSVKRFDDTSIGRIDWALFIAYNRHPELIKEYRLLVERYTAYNLLYDVIVGPIADDSMTIILSDFFAGRATDKELLACLRHVKLGDQYVLKTKEACRKDRIKIIADRQLTFKENKLALAQNTQLRSQMDSILKMYRNKYRRDTSTKFIDEIMEAWNVCS